MSVSSKDKSSGYSEWIKVPTKKNSSLTRTLKNSHATKKEDQDATRDSSKKSKTGLTNQDKSSIATHSFTFKEKSEDKRSFNSNKQDHTLKMLANHKDDITFDVCNTSHQPPLLFLLKYKPMKPYSSVEPRTLVASKPSSTSTSRKTS